MSVIAWCRSALAHLTSTSKTGSRRPLCRRCKPAVEELENRMVPTALSSVLVPSFYQDLLHRPPDPGSAGFAAQLDNGVAPEVVAYQIEAAPGNEFRYRVAARDYQTLLKREGAQAELLGWAKQMESGISDRQVAAMIAGSDEYFALHGRTTEGFLNALYLDVLGRPHTETAFVDTVNQGVSRQAVAYNVLNSPEGLLHQVYLDYIQFLGRSGVGDPGAFGFADAMANGLPHEAVIADLLGSSEYLARQSPIVIYTFGGGQIDPYSPAQPDPNQFTYTAPPIDPMIPDNSGTNDGTTCYCPTDPSLAADDWTDYSFDPDFTGDTGGDDGF